MPRSAEHGSQLDEGSRREMVLVRVAATEVKKQFEHLKSMFDLDRLIEIFIEKGNVDKPE